MLNRSPRNRSNSQTTLDLTSLLDVIFIILFILVMANAQAVKQAEEAKSNAEKVIQNDDAKTKCVSEALDTVENLKNEIDVLTIYCTYSNSNPSERIIEVLENDKFWPQYEVDESNVMWQFTRFETDLRDYLKRNSGKIIFYSINSENILYDDYNRINKLLLTLQEENLETLRSTNND